MTKQPHFHRTTPLSQLPTSDAIRDRLSTLLREAAVLRRLLRTVDQAEKRGLIKNNQCPTASSSESEGAHHA